MMPKSVAIIGCGWLGSKLGTKLLRAGYSVRGSVRSPQKLPELDNLGIKAAILDLGHAAPYDILNFLGEAESVIIAVPPKNDHFVPMMEKLASALRDSTAQIILISSISVYGENSGNVDEYSSVGTTKMALAEKAFADATILRLGGLVGYDRHPGKHLSGRQGIPNPDAPVNLIHADDVICTILTCIDRRITAVTLNVVAPWHPSRKSYYERFCSQMRIPLPEFEPKGQLGKTVNSSLIEKILGFTPDPDLLK